MRSASSDNSRSPTQTLLFVAGESSGDGLAAELIHALRERSPGSEMTFCGAGGSRMRAAGAELHVDLTEHAVVGFWEPIRKLGAFRRWLLELVELAIERRPDAVVLVDYSGFNLRFAERLLKTVSQRNLNWRPRLIYFISPQVWASRPQRAKKIERYFDLLLSIFPFEKAWYAAHAPELRVEFIGHPLVDRYPSFDWRTSARNLEPKAPFVVIAPGSRESEIGRLFSVQVQAALALRESFPDARFVAVAVSEARATQMRRLLAFETGGDFIEIRVGRLPETLMEADLALACSGTVTMEMAWFGVPSVVIYRASWITFQIAKRLITTRFIAMPNILAGNELFPELIQSDLTPEALADASARLLRDSELRERVFTELDSLRAALGEPGSVRRGADAVLAALNRSPRGV